MEAADFANQAHGRFRVRLKPAHTVRRLGCIDFFPVIFVLHDRA